MLTLSHAPNRPCNRHVTSEGIYGGIYMSTFHAWTSCEPQNEGVRSPKSHVKREVRSRKSAVRIYVRMRNWGESRDATWVQSLTTPLTCAP